MSRHRKEARTPQDVAVLVLALVLISGPVAVTRLPNLSEEAVAEVVTTVAPITERENLSERIKAR